MQLTLVPSFRSWWCGLDIGMASITDHSEWMYRRGQEATYVAAGFESDNSSSHEWRGGGGGVATVRQSAGPAGRFSETLTLIELKTAFARMVLPLQPNAM